MLKASWHRFLCISPDPSFAFCACPDHAPRKPADTEARPCDPCYQAAMRRLELLDAAASAAAAAVAAVGGAAEAAAERAAALLDALHDMLRSASAQSSVQGAGLAAAAHGEH